MALAFTVVVSIIYWVMNPRIYTFSYSNEEVIAHNKYCIDNNMQQYIGKNVANRVVILNCEPKDN